MAITRGIWIVDADWMNDSLEEGKLLDCDGYEISGDDQNKKAGGPNIARMRRLRNQKLLFQDYSFFLLGVWESVSFKSIADIIDHCDGRLSRHLAVDSEYFYVVYGPETPSDEVKQMSKKFGPRLKSLAWLFDCVSLYRIC